MTKVYLLQNYKNSVSGDIITVSDEEATIIVKDGVARLTCNRDFLVKPKTYINNIISRAFGTSPKIK